MNKLLRWAAGWAIFGAVAWTVPAWWCRRGADRSFENDPAALTKLADAVEARVLRSVTLEHFDTGSPQFDGEWLFGSYLMAGFGYAQLAAVQPESRERNIARAEECIEKVMSPRVRKFDRDSWSGSDPLDALGSKEDHAAYLGYFNLLLSVVRSVHPQTKYAELNDRITAHLVARLEDSKILLLDTYPGEIYPVDNCPIIASIILHQRTTGADHSELVAKWKARCRSTWIDPKSGVLIQSWNRALDKPSDEPRGSGTALGAFFLSFAEPELARELYSGMCRSLDDGLMGFGAFSEYPPGHTGSGDIDSGPVVFGMGLSATGFGISGAKFCGDRARFAKLYSSAVLAGAPIENDKEFYFSTGGPLGNAILFAMLTTPSPDQIPRAEGSR